MHITNRIRDLAASPWVLPGCGTRIESVLRWAPFASLWVPSGCATRRESVLRRGRRRASCGLCTIGGKSAQEGLLESFSTVFLTGGRPPHFFLRRPSGRPTTGPAYFPRSYRANCGIRFAVEAQPLYCSMWWEGGGSDANRLGRD